MPLAVAILVALTSSVAFLSHRIDALPYCATVAIALLLGGALTDSKIYKQVASQKSASIAFVIGASMFAIALMLPGRASIVLFVFATASMATAKLLADLRH